MIELKVSSIKVNLLSQERVVLLATTDSSRYLPIWIGAYEAEAIRLALTGITTPRPLTHDLVRNLIDETGFKLDSIIIYKLIDEVFHATINLSRGEEHYALDSRPSDAIAIAVRTDASIFVDEHVLMQAGISSAVPIIKETIETEQSITYDEDNSRLGPFRDFLESLDMDDFLPN